MKKFLILTAITVLCAGVCAAATYKIKNNGTVVKPSGTTQSTNYYNNYSAGQYVANNTVNSQPASVIDIVMDFSGSMSGVVDIARRTMSSVVAQIPSSTSIGFRVFGQGDFVQTAKIGKVQSVNKTKNNAGGSVYKLSTGKHQSNGIFGNGTGCRASALVTPIASANASSLISGMNSVELGGSTPMVYALEQAAYSDLSAISRDIKKKIVLITDGGENCGGDPCAFAKTLMATRRDISVDVVLVSTNSKRLQCLANTTGGKVYNLSNVNQFSTVLTQSINSPSKDVPREEENQQQYEFIEE